MDNPALFAPPDQQPSRVALALEYLDLVDLYPVKLKSVIFHIRRMCKEKFNSYQLMEECVQSKSIQEVRSVVLLAQKYDKDGYTFDPDKESKAKAALARRKHEEGKRKRFEERMVRKAKREGKDPGHYLAIGVECPSLEDLAKLKTMTRETAFEIWRDKHSQHCFDFHLKADGGCERGARAPFFMRIRPTCLGTAKSTAKEGERRVENKYAQFGSILYEKYNRTLIYYSTLHVRDRQSATYSLDYAIVTTSSPLHLAGRHMLRASLRNVRLETY